MPTYRSDRHRLLIGIAWTTAAMFVFAGLAVFARAAMNRGVPALQVVFLRNVLALLIMSPLLWMRGPALLQTASLPLYGLRSSIATVSMLAWFSALALIPIGELTAISFLAPLFGTLCAVLVLGEVVRVRRWTALAVGFVGALIILRPGGTPLGLGQLLAVMSAMFGGILAILVKQLTSRDDPYQIVFLTTLIMTPLSLIPALFVWSWPSADAMLMLLGVGVCGVIGHIAVTKAFAALDASLVMTFEFSRLPFAAALAYLCFGEAIDRWTWIGALIIVASAIYITRREAQLKRVATSG